MNGTTRKALNDAFCLLTEGVVSIQKIAADKEADLLQSERKALKEAIPPLMAAIEPVGGVAAKGQERAPGRGMVVPAGADPEAPAPPAAPTAAPVADRGGAGAGLRALALALRDGAMAIRDHADALRELAAASPQGPAAAVAGPPAAPLPAATPDAPAEPAATGGRRVNKARPGARTGAVAADLGIPLSTLQGRIRALGGLAVDLVVGSWRVSRIDYGPGGKAVPRWERFEG